MNTGNTVVSVNTHPMPDGGMGERPRRHHQRHREEVRTAFLARHDLLTGLANRLEFEQKFEEALQRLDRMDEKFGIFAIDLDKFKSVNDTLGHQVGDAVLKGVAERLTASARETDVVARVGGDEFAMLVTHLDEGIAGARAAAHRILDAFDEPFHFGEQTIFSGASIGIALAPRDGTAMDELIGNADLALYRAKSQGRRAFRFFNADEDFQDFRGSQNRLM